MDARLHHMMLAAWRRPEADSPLRRRLLLGLMLVSMAVALWYRPNHQARFVVMACVLATAVFGTWITLAASLLEQNHPNAARLVPGHLRRLREAALLGWLLSSALLGGLLWLSVARAASLPLMLLLSAAAGVYVAWAQRNWLLWFALSLFPALVLPFRLDLRWEPLWTALGELWQAQPWSMLALCLLALGALLVRVFGAGDLAHQAGYARRSCMRRAAMAGMAGNRAGLAMFGKPGEWLGRPFERITSAWLGRLLATATTGRASVMARAEYVLHGRQHWLHHALGVVLAAVFVGLGFGLGYALAGAQIGMAWKAGGFGLGIGLASAGFNPGFTLRNMLWHSRREQTLLALLPGMPQGGALNHAVARMQLRHFLISGVLTTVALLLLARAANQPLLACLPIAALPMGIFSLMRVTAAMPAPTAWTAALPMLAFFAVSGLLWALCSWLSLPVWPLAVLSLALSAALAAWRWRVLGAAPAAMPAGRLD
jgi:hypothetical protein